MPDFNNEFPFSYAPFLSSEYWICLVAEASETVTCVPKGEVQENWRIEGTINRETSHWHTLDIIRDRYNLSMEIKLMKIIKSTDVLPEPPYWIPNCEDKNNYDFLLLPDF